jgi:hypothetical protein
LNVLNSHSFRVGGKQRTVVLFGGIEVFPDRRHKHASRRDDSELARVPAQDIDELGALVDRADKPR